MFRCCVKGFDTVNEIHSRRKNNIVTAICLLVTLGLCASLIICAPSSKMAFAKTYSGGFAGRVADLWGDMTVKVWEKTTSKKVKSFKVTEDKLSGWGTSWKTRQILHNKSKSEYVANYQAYEEIKFSVDLPFISFPVDFKYDTFGLLMYGLTNNRCEVAWNPGHWGIGAQIPY